MNNKADIGKLYTSVTGIYFVSQAHGRSGALRDNAGSRGAGDAQAGRNDHLGIAGHGGAGRIEANGAEVSPNGRKGIAHTYAPRGTLIQVLGKIEGILPTLGSGRHRDDRSQCECYDFFHDKSVLSAGRRAGTTATAA